MQRKTGRPRKPLAVARPVINQQVGRPLLTGVKSPKSILTHASWKERELYRMIYVMEPHLLGVEANKIMVQGLAISLTILDFINKDFAKRGIVDDDGHYRNNIKILISLQKNIARYCNDLGITSATKIKLKMDFDRLKDKGDILSDYKDE